MDENNQIKNGRKTPRAVHKKENAVKFTFESRSINEAFARAAAGAYLLPFDPTLEELNDIKTAVSEAVTNAIVHAYFNRIGIVTMELYTLSGCGRTVFIRISDRGCGIADVKQAMEPLFTTCSDAERSGLGFTMMQSFCDKVTVRSRVDKGTSVLLQKKLSSKEHGGELS